MRWFRCNLILTKFCLTFKLATDNGHGILHHDSVKMLHIFLTTVQKGHQQ